MAHLQRARLDRYGRVFAALRRHGYDRFTGEPFWYHGHYLVRTWRGHSLDLVEVNPYTSAYIGRIAS